MFKVFPGISLRHNAQNHLMDKVTEVFLCSRVCYNSWLTVVSKTAHFKTVVNCCVI